MNKKMFLSLALISGMASVSATQDCGKPECDSKPKTEQNGDADKSVSRFNQALTFVTSNGGKFVDSVKEHPCYWGAGLLVTFGAVVLAKAYTKTVEAEEIEETEEGAWNN